jgi:hypothetical protein
MVHDFLSKSPTTRIVTDSAESRINDDEAIFPALPPLRNGHPDVQLRNGIMRASRLAIANEPDAEKAFFVADLGQVYMQHEKWKKYLPDIYPHYGMWSTFIMGVILICLQPSSATLIHMSLDSLLRWVSGLTVHLRVKSLRYSASEALNLPGLYLPILARLLPSFAVQPKQELTK